MDKKAQGLSLNTIIVAIVVLIVLVVLIMVFTGYFGTRFTPEVTSCSNAGGTCAYPGDELYDANCGTDAFGVPKERLAATCERDGSSGICCPRGLGVGTAPPPSDNSDGTPSCASLGVSPGCVAADSCTGSVLDGTCPGGDAEVCCNEINNP